MAKIFPFRAYRYNSSRVEPVKVLTQPYDKITPPMAEKYAAASPYNLIPVEKGKALPDDSPSNSVYTRAAKALEEWIHAGVVVKDATPSLYVYFQEYTVPARMNDVCARALLPLAASRIIRRELFFATNKHCPGRKRIEWNCCGTRKPTPGSSLCCTTTMQGAWTVCSTLPRKRNRRLNSATSMTSFTDCGL